MGGSFFLSLLGAVFSKREAAAEEEAMLQAAAAKEAEEEAAGAAFNVLNHCGYKYHDILHELVQKRGQPASLEELIALLAPNDKKKEDEPPPPADPAPAGASPSPTEKKAGPHPLDAPIADLAAMLDAKGLKGLLRKLNMEALAQGMCREGEGPAACRLRAAQEVATALVPRARRLSPAALRGPIEVAIQALAVAGPGGDANLAGKLGRIRWFVDHSDLIKPSRLDGYAAGGRRGLSVTKFLKAKLGTGLSVALAAMLGLLVAAGGLWLLLAVVNALNDKKNGNDFMNLTRSCAYVLAGAGALVAWFLVKF